MNRIQTLFAAFMLLAVTAAAQKLSYSAVVRNSANQLVVNKTLTVGISIANTNGGVVQYSETHTATTNQNGLLTLTIGEGTNKSGNMSDVTWASAYITSTYTIDETSMSNTVPVAAVPYALYAESAGNSTEQVQSDWNVTDDTSPAYIQHKPTIPTVNNGTLTIILPDSTVLTFTANQAGNTEVVIPKVTAADIIEAVSNMTDEEKTALCQALNCGGETPPEQDTCPTLGAVTASLSIDGLLLASTPINGSVASNIVYNFKYVITVLNDNSFQPITVDATVENNTMSLGTGYQLNLVDLNLNGKTLKITPSCTCKVGGDTVVVGDYAEIAVFTCGTGTMKDPSNYVYQTVKVGTQCWTKTNLRTTKYRNGKSVPKDVATTARTASYYCPTTTDITNYTDSIYGLYYNGYAAADTGNSKLCPEGWHVPSDAEWNTLKNYLNSQYASDKAKAMADSLNWTTSTNSNAVGNSMQTNNASGYTAVPAGYADGSLYSESTVSANFWSSVSSSDKNAWYCNLKNDSANVNITHADKLYGQSVRCIRDE